MKRDSVNVDRMSALPDEILIHVLSFLPTKHAVRTSVLSNRWRSLWTFSLNITFPCNGGNATNSLQELQVHNINHCIAQVKPEVSLQKFEIELFLNRDFSLDIQRWISFAVARRVCELDLLCFGSQAVKLPHCLFSCKSLSKLILCYSDFYPPLDFHGFSNLKELILIMVNITDQAMDNLLTACPILEDLTLKACPNLKNLNTTSSNLYLKNLFVFDCYSLKKLVVDSPNIRVFKYEGQLIQLSLMNVPLLIEANLQFGEIRMVGSDVKALVTKIAQVQLLTVSSWFAEFIFAEYYLNRTPHTIFKNLKTFHWCGNLDFKKMVLAIATFLGDCPMLEQFHMNLEANDFSSTIMIPHSELGFCGNEHLLQLNFSLRSLKTIKMVGFSETEKQMDLVKFLLDKSVVLELFLLQPQKNKDQKSQLLLQEHLSHVPKKSSCAKIHLLIPPPDDVRDQYIGHVLFGKEDFGDGQIGDEE
ncbi:F-box/FBD/LRR-repeat protein [Thalictrum thalictroides]|uniref:F-box/FBD/LRR-repeat protein n=1 Tax=Thalictrum thalictroides TaxID=46969 RepID=A0A7J6WKL8_THATH|nr:F-box/FBD/LRR-repeat protein [Thalictrum thalictroides]